MMRERMAAARQRRQAAAQAAARETDLPLPLRGTFVRASKAKVSNLYAAELLNMRSNGVSLVLRPGVEWSGSASGVLQRVPFEFGAQSLYVEITATGASAGAVTDVRAFNGDAMATTISANLLLADGLAQPVRFNGTEFVDCAFTAASGPAPQDCDGILAHHDRVYLWQTDGPLDFLYGDIGAVTGALARFPLGRLGNITGTLRTMMSLTLDAGHGMNDVLAVFTSTGQMVIYEGLDPSDENDWRLVARVQGAAPLGKRAFAQVGSDVWMLTAQGIVSVAESARSSTLALVSEIAQPISDEIAALVEAGPAEWQLFTASDGSMVILNRVADGEARQFIYSLESRSWSTADIPARAFHNLAGRPEITGFDGRRGTLRHGGTSEMITGRWVSSWFVPGGEREVTYVEPTIISEGPMTVRVVVLSDQQDRPADIAEAEQIVTLDPEETGGGRVTLSDIVPTDASGKSFQITLEVTARWAEISGMRAAIA